MPEYEASQPLQLDATQDVFLAERNVVHAWRIRGALEVGALGRCLAALKSSTAALGMSLQEHAGSWAVVPLESQFEWLQSDLMATRPSYRETRLHERLRDERYRPFGPSESLARAHLYRLSAEEHVLLWVAHEYVWSRWCADPFLRALSELYAAAVERSELPASAPTMFATPSRPCRRAVQRGTRESFSLLTREAVPARTLASRRDVSLAHVCLAAYWMVLGRQSGSDLSIEVEIQEDAGQPGTLSRCTGDPGPGALVDVLLSLDWALSRPLQPSSTHLATFSFEQNSGLHTHLGGLSCTPIRFRDPPLIGELALTVQETRSGLLMHLDYSPDRFEPETIARIITQYRRTLATCLDAIDLRSNVLMGAGVSVR
jgi:hypothetical protein